jgi:hypothetical protein
MGSIFVTGPATQYLMGFTIGIYVAKYNSVAGTWEVRDPTSAAEAGRDDWLFLRSVMFQNPATGGTLVPEIEVCPMLPHPVVLGGGECLAVVIGPDPGNAAAIITSTYLRARVSQVA